MRHPSVMEKTDLEAKTSQLPVPSPFLQIQIFKSLVILAMRIPEHLVSRTRHPVCPQTLLGLLFPLSFAGTIHIFSSPFIVCIHILLLPISQYPNTR